MEDLLKIGKVGVYHPDLKGQTVYKSAGLIIHIQKRHPECIHYIDCINEILSAPDYIGKNPNESGQSFELVKVYSDNVQIGIKLDVSHGYLYVATLHTITESKLNSRIKSGRLRKI